MNKSILLLVAAAVFSAQAYAESSADLAPEIYNKTPTPTPTNTMPGQTQFPTYIPPPPPPPAPAPAAAKGSINPAANQGQASQNGGAGANAALGAALIAAGMALMANPPTQPAGAALIAMGALAMAQSGADNSAANQSAATGVSSFNGAPIAATTTPTSNPALGTGKSAFSNPALKEGTAALQSAGYSLTPAGLVNPDGSTTPNSAFNSAGGMASAGMDASTIAQVQKALGDATSTIGGGPKVSSVAVSEGGGGGSSADRAPGGDYSFSSKGSVFGLSDAAKKAMIAGKTVSFDGDPIGVRGNNIFEMIHVAYEKKRDNHDFLDGEASGGPALRAPASVTPAAVAVPARAKPAARVQINNR